MRDVGTTTLCDARLFYAGIYIGLIAVHDQFSDRVWTELAVSVDTKTRERIEPGTPLIPYSEEPLV